MRLLRTDLVRVTLPALAVSTSLALAHPGHRSPSPPPAGGGVPTPSGVFTGETPTKASFTLRSFFSIEIIDGALADERSSVEPTAFHRLYDGFPATIIMHTTLPDAVASGIEVGIYNSDMGLLASGALSFTAGASDPLLIPPTPDGSETLVTLGPAGILGPIDSFRTVAAPAIGADFFLSEEWEFVRNGPFDPFGPPVDAVPGPGGSTDTFTVTSPPMPDDPFSGEIGTADHYTFQLLDGLDRPAPYQPVTVFTDDPAVLGFRLPGEDDPAAPLIDTISDADGFVSVMVEYLGFGPADVFFDTPLFAPPPTPKAGEVLVPSGPAATPAPGPDGKSATFRGLGTSEQFSRGTPQLPVVRTVRVTQCGTNPVNRGLREGGAILTFGSKYTFQATLSGPLPPNAGVIWCVNGNTVRDSANRIVTGPNICMTWNDPNGGQPNTFQLKVSAKVVVVNGATALQPQSEEDATFTLTEKKTVPICVVQYANASSNAQLTAAINTVNSFFTGTGVCVSLNVATGVNNVGGAAKNFTQGTVVTRVPIIGLPISSSIVLGGTLTNCICNFANQQGSLSKITVYNGVGINGNTVGFAAGSNEIVGNSPGYDICGKFANTIMIRNGWLSNGTQVLEHEIGHILSLEHHTKTGGIMRPLARTSNRVLYPDEATKMRKIACEILAGQK